MFSLYLLRPTTGQIINSDGSPFQKRVDSGYKCAFSDFDEALREKDQLLRKLEWALVQITDSQTQEQTHFSNEEQLSAYIAETGLLNEYLALPWHGKIFTKKPDLRYVGT